MIFALAQHLAGSQSASSDPVWKVTRFCVKTEGGGGAVSEQLVVNSWSGWIIAGQAHQKFIEAMILLQRPSVKLAYLLIKQFYLINSFGPSVYQPEHCKWLVTRIPDRTHHPHTSQCCQAWGGLSFMESRAWRSDIRVSHVESGGEHYINYDRSTGIN